MKSIFKFILIFSLLSLNSCATNTSQTKKSFKWPRQSFVKFETRIYRQTCIPKDPDNFKSKCYEDHGGFTGSGAVVARSFDGVYVLTAGHMCDRKEDLKFLENRDKKIREHEKEDKKGKKTKIKQKLEYTPHYIIKFYVYDLENFKYKAKTISVNKKLDACTVFVWGLFKKPLVVSSKKPKIGAKAYNMAAPAGFFQKNLVPLFEGRYVGKWSKYASVYTIPAIGGSSGSPVINSKGELIGMIYARHNRFHHIVLSPDYKRLRKFLFSAIEKDSKKRKREQEIDRARSIIIRFNEKL